jgi:uncharacterized protein
LILLDANILLYAYDSEVEQHGQAKAWLEALLASNETIGLPWQTAWAFIRIRTNMRSVKRPVPASEALRVVQEWVGLPGVVMIGPGKRHLEILESLVLEEGAIGPLVSDAALAALAIEQGATLASTDRDFGRFRGLTWVNPLA